jgi:rare lipoprotein A
MRQIPETLPLGAFVRILNFSSNKQIIVRINDRGPFVKGRIIDLSYAAAKKIETYFRLINSPQPTIQ